MDSNAANPFIIALMFVARCLVPLIIMLGISYILRRFGLIQEPPKPPADLENGSNNNNGTEGDVVHGKI